MTQDGGETFPAMRGTSYDLRMKYATFDPAIASLNIETQLLADESNTLHIVQFVSPSMAEYRTAITAAGGVIRGFLTNHSHLVDIDDAGIAQLTSNPFVRSITPYHPAYRLEPYLRDNLDNAGTLFPLQRYQIMVAERGMNQKTAVADRITLLGGTIDELPPGGFLLDATLTPEQLLEVAAYNEVLFIDRWGEVEFFMDVVQELSGGNYVATRAIPGYTGQGVRGDILDQGLRTSHIAFQQHPPIIRGDNFSDQDHGTQVFGIVFGDGTGAPIEHPDIPPARGVIPDAQGIFGSVRTTASDTYCHFCEIIQSDCQEVCFLPVDSRAPFEAVFHSRSFGLAPKTADYTLRSAELDDAAFQFDLLICQAQANSGTVGISTPEAWSKNLVSVGGFFHATITDDPEECDTDAGNFESDDDTWNGQDPACRPFRASKGPAADGRVKPDLAHFVDDILTTGELFDSDYDRKFGGTSSATPITCGHFGLFFQMWADGIFGNPFDPNKSVFENRPHAMTAKAMMINTAHRYIFNPDEIVDPQNQTLNPDIDRDVQGWGVANVQKLYNIAVRGGFLEIIDESRSATLYGRENPNVETHVVIVPEDAYALNITLAWRDPPGNPASAIARINDLGVFATPKPWVGTNPMYHGNIGLTGANATNWSYDGAVRGEQLDAVNTVENLFIPYPQAGAWLIYVWGYEVNQDADPQTPEWDVPYALVASVDYDCDGNGVPDSQDSEPIQMQGCPHGGSSGGNSGELPETDLSGNCGPGAGIE